MVKFKEMKVGNEYVTNLLVTNIEERTARNGSIYCDISLSDGEQTVIAKYFNSINSKELAVIGNVAECTINVNTFQSNVSYILQYFAINNNANIADFIITAPIESKKMFDMCISLFNEAAETAPVLAELGEEIYEKNKEKLLRWSAAKSMHHNCYGGLLYHSLRMALSAKRICQIYTKANRGLVIIGCLLHDIGKLKELDTDIMGNASYTVNGNLFGHLMLGVRMVEDYTKDFTINSDELEQLQHIIASHHYNQEWGAISQPKTIEAFIVAKLDDFDAKMYMIEKGLEELESCEISEKPIYDGIRLYKPERGDK